MSNEGLVRTLLYQVLEKMPGLIPLVFPHQAEEGIMFGDYAMEEEPWTWGELLNSFRNVIKKVTETTKIIFFVDSMDEFRGESSDVVDLVTSLVAPKVKICASSWPWIVFEDAFQSRPQLRPEDLTLDDVNRYVMSK